MRLRIGGSEMVSQFVAFAALPGIAVRRIDEGTVELSVDAAEDEERIVADLMLAAWNAAHPDAPAKIVED